MAATKRTPDQVLRDRVDIMAHYLRGKSQDAIAVLLTAAVSDGVRVRAYEVSRDMVKKDIEAVRKQWLGTCVKDYDQKKALELAKIDHLEAEAWAAYDRSVGEVKTSTIEYAPVTDPKTNVTKMSPMKGKDKKEQRAGDPRFLERVGWCIDRRIRLFGMDAPVDIPAAELEQLLQDELAKLREAERLQAEAAGGDLDSARVM